MNTTLNFRLFLRTLPTVLFVLGLLPFGILTAERAPDRLARPDDVHQFYDLSARLNCKCSCHGLLGDCPHNDEDCFGVQTRQFLETRILEGMSTDAILTGFVEGFGDRVRADLQLRHLASRGREDLVEGYVRGFGPDILHTEPSYAVPLAFLILGSVVFVLLVFIFVWRPSRRASSPAGTPSSDDALNRSVRDYVDELER